MKSKKLLILSASLLSLLLGGSTAMAQRGGGTPPGPQQFSRFQLATLPEVQSEIGLDDSMKKSATEMLEKMREEQRSLMQGGGEDRQAAMAKVIDMRKKLDGEFVAKLDEKQKSRLTGIMVQVVGASSLMDAEVQTVLGVTDDQKKALAEAQTKNREATRESMQGLRDLSPEERNEQMAKMRTESDKVLLAVLTEEQKSKMETLKGAELKVDVSSLRGRGGPGGRPRRDN